MKKTILIAAVSFLIGAALLFTIEKLFFSEKEDRASGEVEVDSGMSGDKDSGPNTSELAGQTGSPNAAPENSGSPGILVLPSVSLPIDRDAVGGTGVTPVASSETYTMTEPTSAAMSGGRAFHAYDVDYLSGSLQPMRLVVPHNIRVQVIFGGDGAAFSLSSASLGISTVSDSGERRSVVFDSQDKGKYEYIFSTGGREAKGEIVVQ